MVPKTPRNTSRERKKKYLKILFGCDADCEEGFGGDMLDAPTIGGTGGSAVGTTGVGVTGPGSGEEGGKEVTGVDSNVGVDTGVSRGACIVDTASDSGAGAGI